MPTTPTVGMTFKRLAGQCHCRSLTHCAKLDIALVTGYLQKGGFGRSGRHSRENGRVWGTKTLPIQSLGCLLSFLCPVVPHEC